MLPGCLSDRIARRSGLSFLFLLSSHCPSCFEFANAKGGKDGTVEDKRKTVSPASAGRTPDLIILIPSAAPTVIMAVFFMTSLAGPIGMSASVREPVDLSCA